MGLPWRQPALGAIAAIYLVRAIGGSGAGGYLDDTSVKETAFSTIALVIGGLYAIGALALYRQDL